MSATLDKLAYTTPEACRLLSIGPTTLYSLSKQGKLTPVKIVAPRAGGATISCS